MQCKYVQCFNIQSRLLYAIAISIRHNEEPRLLTMRIYSKFYTLTCAHTSIESVRVYDVDIHCRGSVILRIIQHQQPQLYNRSQPELRNSIQ